MVSPRARWKLFFAALLCAVIVLAIWLGPPSPNGCYEEKNVGAIGHVYWRLDDGRIDLITEESKEQVGTYQRSGNAWVWLNYDKSNTRVVSTNRIEPYWWGVRLSTESSETNEVFVRFLWRCPHFWK